MILIQLFDNQCINPVCRYNGNPTHSARKNNEGINRASTETPLYCLKCGHILPRPWVKEDGKYRLMKGYTSAYKNGMHVRNNGVELTVIADLLPAELNAVSWNFALNLSYNNNKLIALPDGLQEVIIGNNKLSVGRRIDAFWVLLNNSNGTAKARIKRRLIVVDLNMDVQHLMQKDKTAA